VPGLAKWSVENEGLLNKYRTYKAMVKCLDDQVGEVLSALDENGLRENTMVVFLSDNGPHPIAGGGKARVVDMGVRVPMVMRWPGKIDPDTVCSSLAMSVDIYPTLVEAAGAEMPDDVIFDGKSLLPLLRGDIKENHEFGYAEKKGWMGLFDHEWFYATWAGRPDQEKFYPRITPPDVTQDPLPLEDVPDSVKKKFRKWADDIRDLREETLKPHLTEKKTWIDEEIARREALAEAEKK
jgi:arylsulfatase A-like enzyme